MKQEDKLLLDAMAGDHAAFNTLVEKYKAMVYGFAYNSVRNRDDALDIAQNVFVSVFLNVRQLDDKSKFIPWLRRITSNACYAYLRQMPVSEPLDPLLWVPDQVPSLLTKLVVDQALSCLSEQTRLTLTLFYFGTYSHAEIAAFLDIPVSAVKSRLRDGRARLKKGLMTDMVEVTYHEQAPGPDFNEKVTALINASIRGNTENARQLLAGDESLVNAEGGVAEEHVEYMRSVDADHGWTPLHLAAHYGNIEIVKLLLDNGADIEAVAKNSIGNMPISAAAWGNHLDIVAYLIDHGANVNAVNAWGATALHRAVNANRLPLAELLLAHGANPNLKDNHGETPLDTARKDGKADLIELLTQPI